MSDMTPDKARALLEDGDCSPRHVQPLARAYLAEHDLATVLETEFNRLAVRVNRLESEAAEDKDLHVQITEALDLVDEPATPDDILQAIDLLRTHGAERDRLARILAVERGDESQAPAGWRWFYDDDFGGLHQARWSRPFVRVQLDHEGDKSNPWHVWRPRSGGVGWSSHPGRDWYPTALEAMEAADKAAGVTCD